MKKLRIIALLTALLLLLSALPAFAASFQAQVKSTSMKVYSESGNHAKIGTLKKGTVVTVTSYAGNIAHIVYKGHKGLASVKDMKRLTDATVTARTTKATRVYLKANSASRSVKVASGLAVNVLGTDGSYSKVERNGVVGYILTANLEITDETVTVDDDDDDDLFDSTDTNEKIIYRFLTSYCGYNSAAACGILANMRYESNFNPTCSGDNSTSYGLVQWHKGLYTNLKNWCGSNGYDYKTLKGQLYFLKYDLPTNYKKVDSYLRAVENSDQGAYDAAYYFCYNFEVPANRAVKSVTRGNYAKNIEWPKFN